MPSSAWRSGVALDCSTRGRATPQVGDRADLALVTGLDAWAAGAEPVVLATLLAGAWTHRG